MRNWVRWLYFSLFLTLALGHNTAPSRWRRPRRSPSLTDVVALHKLMLGFKLAKRTYCVEIRKRFWQLIHSGNRDVDF